MFRRLMMQTHASNTTWVYGVREELAEPNPSTRWVYTDDCAGFTPCSKPTATTVAMNSWESNPIFEKIYPVMRVGSTVTRLNKTNLNQDIDGNTVSTTANKFTHYEKMYMKITSDGTYRYWKLSNVKGEGFSDWCFSRNGTVRNYFELGCYKGYVDGSVLTSRTGVSPTVLISLKNSITYAQTGAGSGYDINLYNNTMLVQFLFILLFKNSNSQASLGMGYVGGSAKQNTGVNNTLINEYGMYGDTSSSTSRVSFLWGEDLWGNIYEWIGGLKTDASYNFMVGDVANTTGSGYTSVSSGLSGNIDGYISNVSGQEKTGFLPIATSGSDTLYYCDYGIVIASSFPSFGGYWSSSAYAGIFFLYVIYSAANTYSYLGARLSYGGE